ncbi:MAG: T9SS type A sorting domain-containing protein [Candidatus Hydrothermae bacterium]|nr:T9SS type A sorting domain-containing protein [Candidatus Hydrothermae bacterium]
MFLSLLTIVVSAVFPITQTPWVEKGISVGKVSGGFVVAWQDLRNGEGEIYASFLTDKDTKLFPVATASPSSGEGIYFSCPTFASEGNHGLFVYEVYSSCLDTDFGYCSSIDYTTVDVGATNEVIAAGGLHGCQCPTMGYDYGFWYTKPHLVSSGRYMLLASLNETFSMGVVYTSIVADLLKPNGQILYTHNFLPTDPYTSLVMPPAVTSRRDGFVLVYPELALTNGDRDLAIVYFYNGQAVSTKKTIGLDWDLSYHPIPEIASIGNIFLYTVGLSDGNSTGVLVFEYPDVPADIFTLPDAQRAFPVAAFGKFYIFYISADDDIYAVRYDPQTGLIDSSGVPVIITPEPITELSAAFDGEKIFLSFVQNEDIYGVFLDSDLQEINNNPVKRDAEPLITINPNPIKGNILKAHMRIPEEPVGFEVYDASGRTISTCKLGLLNGSEVMIELPGSIRPGVYFLAAKTRKKIYRTLFIKM